MSSPESGPAFLYPYMPKVDSKISRKIILDKNSIEQTPLSCSVYDLKQN